MLEIMKTEITRADIMDMADYAKIRKEKRSQLMPVKRNRRLAVGPYATFHFESYDTMWLQVHEMLFIEKGGEAQIADELQAYNPLIPKGDELVATVLFEIDDPVRRRQVLGALGGVEETMTIEFDGKVVKGEAEEDVDRTTADGKASSVQFVHFRFTAEQAAAFRKADRVMVGITHPNYPHMTVLPEAVQAALAEDLTV
ncbi:MAG: DUF3501 family protein [Azospirillaceae bacterium]